MTDNRIEGGFPAGAALPFRQRALPFAGAVCVDKGHLL